ncbi:hypothetical protein Tco_1569194 [Tanacetum coccineum]
MLDVPISHDCSTDAYLSGGHHSLCVPSFSYMCARLRIHASNILLISSSIERCKSSTFAAKRAENILPYMSYSNRPKADVVDRMRRIKAIREIQENVVINNSERISFRSILFYLPSFFVHAYRIADIDFLSV